MNDEILKNIWTQLTSDGMTKSSFEEWKSNLQDPEIQENIHSYLVENEFTDSDLPTWQTNTGLKKKRRNQYGFRIGGWFFGFARLRAN